MRCSKCNSDNREGHRFCRKCGSKLGTVCPKCGVANEPNEDFCGDCGAALNPSAEAVAEPTQITPSGERRHLTVLFCDLVGSTEIAAQLDPEEWRELVAAYHRAATEAIIQFGGYVAQYLGDGVMAYFGWPEAHDNDAERAARAGLAILEAVSKLNDSSTRPHLTARVGIDSGAVVVGASADKGADVFGDTPNIAARVQAAAESGTVVITDATYRLVSGLFVVNDRGAQALKGIERPVQLYRVIQPSGARGRLEATAATRGLTPFVGRENELRLLMSRWERVLDSEGQVALLIGEAGIGKSRLLQRFHEQIGDTPHTWIEAHAGAFFQNTPFYPVTELIQQFIGANGGKPAEEQLAQLEPRLESAGLKPLETIPLIAPLLNLPFSDKYPPSPLSPQQQRRRLLATLVEWVLGLARVQPLIVVTEDLHWADASTLELIQLLVEQGATARMLLLYTARPEFRAQWPLRAHHTQITLSQLSARNVRVLVEKVAARKAMSDETIATLIERTGGVPLFVEELTLAVLESGTTRLSGREIPVTMHDSLMARLDRLGPAKEIIQIGAVIGNEFSYGLLNAIHPIGEERLLGALRRLADAGLLYVRGIASDATYQFKHALIRDTAYEALLRRRRKELHSRIAEVLVQQFSDTTISSPELLAHHYTEAGLITQAIPHWQRAGERASQRSAHSEAIAYLTRGLELLKTLPDTLQRARQELTLQLVLGTELTDTNGYAAPAVEHAYSRALELSRQMEESPQLFSVLRGLQLFYMMRSEFPRARTLAEQLLSLAQRQHDPVLLLGAHSALGQTLYYLGDFALAMAHLEQGLALYDPQQQQYQTWAGGYLGIQCVIYAAWVLWFLGYPDQAFKKSQEALTLAEELSHPASQAATLYGAVMLHYYRREWQRVQECLEALMPLATEQGFAFRVSRGTIFRGRMLVEQGHVEEGSAQIRQGIAADQAIGAEVGRPLWLTLLAEGHGKAGQVDEGLNVLAEGLTVAHKTREGLHEAEIYRLSGELTLRQAGSRLQALGDREKTEEAEACFLRAIAVAQKQQAKSLELRAATSLGSLWQHHGKQQEAHAMLAEIYNRFTEGFDTADLKEAKALLDELEA